MRHASWAFCNAANLFSSVLHPQLVTCLFRKLPAEISFVFPQSHRHSHIVALELLHNTLFNANKFPNLFPVSSRALNPNLPLFQVFILLSGWPVREVLSGSGSATGKRYEPASFWSIASG